MHIVKIILICETYLIPGETLVPGGSGSPWYWICLVSTDTANPICVLILLDSMRSFLLIVTSGTKTHPRQYLKAKAQQIPLEWAHMHLSAHPMETSQAMLKYLPAQCPPLTVKAQDVSIGWAHFINVAKPLIPIVKSDRKKKEERKKERRKKEERRKKKKKEEERKKKRLSTQPHPFPLHPFPSPSISVSPGIR